jgi:hypothetical protein
MVSGKSMKPAERTNNFDEDWILFLTMSLAFAKSSSWNGLHKNPWL